MIVHKAAWSKCRAVSLAALPIVGELAARVRARAWRTRRAAGLEGVEEVLTRGLTVPIRSGSVTGAILETLCSTGVRRLELLTLMLPRSRTGGGICAPETR